MSSDLFSSYLDLKSFYYIHIHNSEEEGGQNTQKIKYIKYRIENLMQDKICIIKI